MVKIHSNFIRLLDFLQKEKSQKADAVVWLQGNRYDRGRKVLNLFRKKMAKKIIISGNNQLIGSEKRIGEDNISLDEMFKWLEDKGADTKRIIIEKQSFDTKDQASNVLKIAKRNKWKKIILVASLYHQLRVFLTFLKSAKRINWKGILINQPVIVNWNRVPSGGNKTAKKLFRDELEKIEKYHNDISTVKEGLLYFQQK